MNIKAIDEVLFINEVNIRALNINSYFKRFKSKTLSLYSKKPDLESEKDFESKEILKRFFDIEKQYINFIKECYRFNNGNLIIDFYINRLDDRAVTDILNNLNHNEKNEFLNLIDSMDKDKIYFKINNEDILDIIVKLNTRNLFFSTFYFLEKEITVWGNYNLQFPIFFNMENIIEDYDEIAKNNKLNLINNNYENL